MKVKQRTNKINKRGIKRARAAVAKKTVRRIAKETPNKIYKANSVELAELLKNGKIAIPHALQRRYCWEHSRRTQFIESASGGMALDSLMLVDLRSAKKHCEGLGDEISVAYFTSFLDDGYEFILLDGQNRLVTLQRLYDGVDTISGTFKDADGVEHVIVNKKFADLTERLQDKLADIELLTIELGNITRSGISIQFQRLNSGLSLNGAEIRNCILTPMAEVVRELSTRYRSEIEWCLTDKNIRRMGDDDLIAKSLMVLMYGPHCANPGKSVALGLGDGMIKAWYEQGLTYLSMSDKGCPYPRSELVSAKAILKKVLLAVKAAAADDIRTSKQQWWSLLLATQWVHHNGDYEIHNYKEFYNGIKVADKNLRVISEGKYAQDRQMAIRKKKDPDTVKREGYYCRWVDLPHQADQRIQRYKVLSRSLTQTYQVCGLRLKPEVSKKKNAA
jgi:hypothetical protein